MSCFSSPAASSSKKRSMTSLGARDFFFDLASGMRSVHQATAPSGGPFHASAE